MMISKIHIDIITIKKQGGIIIKNKIIAITALFLFLIAITCVNAAEINENVTLINDDDPLNVNIGDFSSLYGEITKSSQTKAVNLTKDYVYNPQNDKNYSNGINIDIDDLTIDGQGHCIDAAHQARVFNIQSKNVVLKNLVITNGNANPHGGAIYWTGLNGEIINSTFKNNTASSYGGAVSFKQASKVTNSQFIANTAMFGGAIDFGGDSFVEKCEFENNFATFLGGAVYCFEKINISDSSFSFNKAGDGGGIYLESTGLIENNTFNDNIAIGYGGAIANEDEIIINNSKFTCNTGNYAGAIFLKGNGNIKNSLFTENSAEIGGAVYANWLDVIITNNEFKYNMAKQGSSLYINTKSALIENISFVNNQTSYESEITMKCSTPKLVNLTYQNITQPEKKIANNTTNNNKTINNNTTVKPKAITKKKTVITAKSKTYKIKTKTKKYIVTLKSGKSILKYKKIYLKVKGKTYSIKTNKKGQAIFKLKITKKGKFKAVITFKGDKTYKSSKKTVYMKIIK